MVSKKMYWKNLRKNILSSKARFLSIFSIVFLGAAFFAGLRNTPGTMMKSMDSYLDQHRFADLTYIATLGFGEDDLKAIENIQGIEIEYGYQFDAQTLLNNKLTGIKVLTSSQFDENMINYPDLQEGRFPKKSDECVIDSQMALMQIKIGDQLKISNNQGEKAFTVVGIVNDVRYLAITERGTNTLGDGTNEGFIEILNEDNDFLAMPKELYDLRDEDLLYNQLSVKVEGAEQYNIFSHEYDEYIEDVNTKLKSTLSLRMSDLYETISSEAKEELRKAEKKYNNGYDTFVKNKDNFDATILKAKIQLTNAKIELAKNETQYLKAQGQAGKEVQKMLETVEQTAKELESSLDSLNKKLEDYKDTPILSVPPEIKEIQKQMGEIQKIIQSSQGAIDGFDQLNNASMQIQQAKLQIEAQENQLTLTELQTRNELESAQKELDKSKILLDEAKEDMNAISKGKVYTLTRHEIAGIVSYDTNVESITAIAKIFPLLFFLVSALVSLTTMTRMVEEQRGQSGTLRALGYSKWDVIKQYIVYVIMATFFACVLGIVIGTELFPRIIYYLYNLMMFKANAPTLIYSGIDIAFQTFMISVFVTLFATLSVCFKELNLTPAVLMRPKSPKIGKRILIERITFIWKRMSFNQKVTMRNIFRYKKRFFMSIIGIAGCTALIITGFGIKNSVSQIVPKQFDDIFIYDGLARLEEEIHAKEAKDYQEQLLKRDDITNVEYVYSQSIEMMKNKEDIYANLVVYQSMDNIQNFIQFRDLNTQKKLSLDEEGVILSVKAAEILGVHKDDTLDFQLNDVKYSVKVSGITENYFMHYMYMSQTLYENITNESLNFNNAYVNLKDDTPSNRGTIEAFMKDKGYGNISYNDSSDSDFMKQIDSIDIVVVILIVCAGALNFIVLYNLTNINIQERKSEIATIKVLGFRRKEVYDYIFRENIILSVIGSIVGMFLGFVVHMYIIRTVELDLTMFERHLNVMSYVYAVAITIGFTMLINFTMRRVLNKVNMVESLKSIE